MGKAQENTTMVCITVGRSGHLPSEVPGHAEDVRVLRPWQVFGLMDGHTECLPTFRRFPVREDQCYDGVRFQLPLRGSAGIGLVQSPHRLPF